MILKNKFWLLFLTILTSNVYLSLQAMEKDEPKAITYGELFHFDVWDLVLKQFLEIKNADILFLNELCRQVPLSAQVYNKIIESYIDKTLDFFPKDSDISNIMERSFKTANEKNLSKAYFQENISDAFERYITKYPFGKFKDYIDMRYYIICLNKYYKLVKNYILPFVETEKLPEDKKNLNSPAIIFANLIPNINLKSARTLIDNCHKLIKLAEMIKKYEQTIINNNPAEKKARKFFTSSFNYFINAYKSMVELYLEIAESQLKS